MQIKKNRIYKLLVQVCKNEGISFSYEKLVLSLNKYIDEDEEDSVFGYKISDIDISIAKHISVDICGTLALSNVICQLTCIGSGDCPNCGGLLRLIESYPKFSKQYCDRDCEPEREEENVYECLTCGKEVIL
nr:MAG: Nucleic-acid-binding protein containing Zn-ribbon domain [Bacteriophage sp.]